MAEPEVQSGEGEEGADGVEQGIVGRSGAAGDEGLMDFVEDGVACGDGQSRDAPGPAPASAIAADPAVDQEAEDKIFSEVGAFADDVVDEIELVFGEMRKEPFHEEGKNCRGVFGGEGVGGERENDAGPSDGGPPGAEPRGDEQLVETGLHLWKLRGGTRIAPRLRVRQV